MTTVFMKLVIRSNGHLILEGNESREEMLEAIKNLYSHTWDKCHMPELGIPMAALIPDKNALTIRSYKKRTVNVKPL